MRAHSTPLLKACAGQIAAEREIPREKTACEGAKVAFGQPVPCAFPISLNELSSTSYIHIPESDKSDIMLSKQRQGCFLNSPT